MAVYHLHWRGTRDGTQTGWYIHDKWGNELGRILWQADSLQVVYNDGSLYRSCSSHQETFEAAEQLVAYYTAPETTERSLPDFPT